MTIVRESNLAGSCIKLGELVRETDRFYVYRSEYPGEGEKRVAKRPGRYPRIHIVPCVRCEDHPQSHYPNGYDG